MIQSFLEGIKNYIETCPAVQELYDTLNIDTTDETAHAAVIMSAGQVKLETTVIGYGEWQYNADFCITNCTQDDISKVENNGLIERLIYWVEVQNYKQNYPEVPEYAEATGISADNGMLFEVSEDGMTGSYRVQIHLTYYTKFKEE